jgi:hypothetical protein
MFRLRSVIVTAILIIGLGAMSYAAFHFASGQEEPPGPGDTRLLAATRDHLSICVDGAGGLAVGSSHKERIENALSGALQSVRDLPPEYQSAEVSLACPTPAAQIGNPISKFDIEGRLVEVPSEHRLLVYLLPDDLYAATFSGESYVESPEEYMCSGDTCVTVTVGLYLPVNVDLANLEAAILEGLTLTPRTPVPDPTIDWHACERGELPHPDLTCDDYEEELEEQERKSEGQ